MQKELDSQYLDLIHPQSSQAEIYAIRLYYFAKRLFDILFACTVIVLILPLLAIIAVLVMLDSPGPPIFIQERVGAKWHIQNGAIVWQRVLFHCLKFRTMIANADSTLHKKYIEALIKNDKSEMSDIQGEDVEVRKLVHDPRITHLGKLLRKFSLDELPQFWNVLIGDMSVVGPRPAIPYEVDLFQPWHYQRFNAKPGITGLCQVTCRCSADFDDTIRVDIEYIRTQTFWKDLQIILKTPWVLLTCRGAY